MSIILGTSGNNTLVGTSSSDLILAGAGNDTIAAGAGNDVVDAGSGNDTVDGGAGNDLIYGGAGNDALNGGAGIDILIGGAGNDSLVGGSDADVLAGGAGNDTLDGGSGTDIVSGADGNDTLVYRVSENVGSLDLYDGGHGRDTLRVFATSAQAASSGFVEDIARLRWLIDHTGSATTFLDSLGLQVVSIERVEVIIVGGGSNTGPTAVADNVAAIEDTAITITAASLLSNDTDPDAGDTRTLVSVASGQNGTAVLDQSGNVIFTPAANFSGTASFTYTMRDAAGATSTATVFVSVAGVADAPTLTAGNASGDEDTGIPLSIAATQTDTSETLSILISGVPAGATLSAGADNGDGTWSLTSAELSGLTLMPPSNFSGAIVLTVSATSADGSDAAVTTTTLTVDVAGVADAPTLTAGNASGDEDTGIPLSIAATQTDTSETLSILISGVPAGATLSAGTNNLNGTWSLTPAQLSGLTLMPASNFSGSIVLTVSATSADGSDTAVTTTTLTVDVAGVADAPTLTAGNASGDEDTGIPLSIAAALTDTSETLSILISGVPADAILSAGTNNLNGTWSLTSAELSGLTLMPPSNFSGAIVLTVSATSADGSDAAVTTTTLTVDVAGVADAPTLTAGNASGDEDTGIPLSIAATQTDTSETLSILISGVPAGATLSAGTNNLNGTWSLTPAQLSGLTLMPASNFSGSIVLTVSATSADGSDTAATTTTLTVDVAGVADAPTLTGLAISVDASSSPIPLGLYLAATDGSETLGAVTISGVNGGYVLSSGTRDEDGDWVVAAADVAGLTMLPGSPGVGTFGTFNLHVTATSIDGTSVASTSIDLAVNVSAGPDARSGRAFDGYVSGATVFADADGNGLLDAGEASTTTAADGTFTIVGGTGNLVMVGGTDVSTGLAFLGTLSAPSGSTVITPLTTLVAALVTAANPDQNDPVAVQAAVDAAQAAIASAFGLDPSIDLQTFDPVVAAAAGDANATDVLSAGIQVQTTIAQISAAGGSATSQAAVVSAVAGSISEAAVAGDPVDLTQASTLSSIIEEAAPSAGQAAIDAVSQVVAAANDAIATAASGTGDALSVLSNMAQAATVALGQTTDQLTTAGLDETALATVVTDNTGTNLTDAIAAAPVGDPDGSQVGTLGNDTLTGGGGNDVIEGLDGNDTLSGDGGNDTIRGGNGADSIFGGDGNDNLEGGDGKDILTGGAGDDAIDGGNSVDRVSYADATGAIAVNLANGTASGAGVGNDTLTSVEAAVGSDFADTFDATGFTGWSGLPGVAAGYNEFEGRGGDDTIAGFVNAQGQALTRVSYVSATGAVTVDIAAGTAGGDTSVGHDTFSNVNAVTGSASNDMLYGSNNAPGSYETFDGRRGDDFIDGRGGYDQAAYNNDPSITSGISVQLAAGTVTGDASVGTDTLRAVEAVRGTQFDDVYDASGFGTAGALNIGSSGTFNDFAGAGGNDTVIGNGATRLNYSLAAGSVSVDLETSVIGTTNAVTVVGTATGVGEGTDSLTGVNAVQGSVFGDTLLGSSFSNTFTGLGGDDHIDGRGGFDTASFNSMGLATAGVSINLASGSVIGDASVGTDTLRSIEGVQGTNYADTFVATGYGVLGALNVSNSNGNFNQFEGLGGDDVITGNGNTRLGYFNATAGVTVTFTGAGTGTADGNSSVGHDTFTGANGAQGSNFNDVLNGSNANEALIGGAGDDALNGGGGSDTITGSAGNDAIDGGAGADIAVFTGPRSGYTINFNTPGAGQTQIQDNTANRDGTDTLTGVEILQFNDAYYVIASGTSGSPINLTGLGFNGGVPIKVLTGTNDDFLTIGQGLSNRSIDLGAGLGDTITLGITGGYNLNLVNVENLNGTGGDDFVSLVANASGLTIDLGAGINDGVNLANGANTVSVANVENLNGSDFAVGSVSNDTLTLGNNVGGVSINLGNGTNTLNLASGANSLVNAFNIATINGTAFDDTLTLVNGVYQSTINLGGGTDTLILTNPTGFSSLGLVDVENVVGGTADDYIVLQNAVTGVTFDLGIGNDTLNLANGSNSVGVIGVETINGSDFGGTSPSNDTLTLLNNVSSVRVNLGDGTNTLNLAAGANSLVDAGGINNTINGTALDDTLTVVNGVYQSTINLGDGTDTLILANPAGFSALGLVGVENVAGGTADEYIVLQNAVTGVTFDLGIGNDTLNLVNGSNSIGVLGVETINGSDFGGTNPSNDSLTLLNNVNGVVINLGDGANAVNLAGGANSLTLNSIQSVNGTLSDDSLTSLGQSLNSTIDLGDGTDTLTLAGGFNNVTVNNVENVFGGNDADGIVIANTTGSTTVTGGLGADSITASAGQDNVRYTSSAESAAGGGGDTVTNFDAANDTIVLDHVAGLAGGIHFVSNGIFNGTPGVPQSEARLAGNVLQIDVDGDGQIGAGDIEIALNGLSGTLTDANFITTGVNHAPTDISLVGSTVAEDSLAGTIVGSLSNFDPDAGDTATYSIVNPTGAFGISGNNLVVAGVLDYESGASQQVTVRVTDSGGLTYDEVFNIGITDANDAPTVTSGATGSVAENAAASTVVYQATAADPDATAPNNAITWSLTGTDALAFSIDGGGNVRLNSSADYEAKSSYSINVVATDGGNLSSSLAVTVNVSDANDAPTVTSGGIGSVAENAAAGAAVYQATASDPDGTAPNNTISWSLTGTDAAAFSIDASGQVTLNGLADYEARSSYSINVVATDGGSLSNSQAVTIGVTDVNEAPTVSSGGTASVAENAATSTVVYQATATDPDTTAPNSAITWSLSGTDAAAFSIDASGQVTLNNSADYEAGNSYSINVVATDGGTLLDSKAVTVSVTNVNEAPTDILLSNASIAGASALGAVVGALSTIDPDASDTATFALTDDAGGLFAISGGNLVVANSLSSVTSATQQVTVRATDANGLTFDRTLTLTVTGITAGGTFLGDANDNTLNGTDGNDIFTGLAGNDTLNGTAGQDITVYSDATGGITVNMAAGTVIGDASVGTDTLSSIEAVEGSNFADSYVATGYGATSTNAGSPSLMGPVNNTFEGMGGDDVITGSGRTTASYFHATAGVTVNLSSGATNGSATSTAGGDAASVGNDTLIGVNWVRGSEYADVLNGGAGNDVFVGGAGNDAATGGSGFDLMTYAPTFNNTVTSGIAVNMTTGIVTGDASTGSDTLRSIETVRGTNFADTYTATNFGAAGFTNAANFNVGNNGTFNEFEGMGGNDTITGNNNTRILFWNASGAVTIDLAAGTADGDVSVGHDNFSGVVQVRGSSFNDTLLGSNNVGFTEVFDGWRGNDFIDGRGGFDQVTYNNNNPLTTSGVVVNMASGTVVGDASIGTDTLRSIEQVFGSNFADTYDATNFGAAGFQNASTNNVGNNGTFNSFQGLAGNDLITGNGNTQILYGNATVSGVTVDLAAGTAVGDASVGSDTITGGVNNVQGTNFDDTITGGAGNETLGGGNGNDTLNGAGGSDAITGGGGNDIIDGGAGGDMAVYAGTIGQYTTVTAGSVSGNGEGTDTISNIEVLQFGTGATAPAYYLVASGTAGTPVDISGLNLGGTAGLSSLTGNTDDFVTIGQNFFGRPINLGAGSADTVNLGIAGVGYTLALSGVENLNGTAGDEFVTLTDNANGLAVDLGSGNNDFLQLANGANSFSVANVEFIQTNDFVGSSDDTLFLLNNVSGVTVNLNNGNNTLNLAAGINSLTNAHNVQTINGSASNDDLTIGNITGSTFNMGDGTDTLQIATAGYTSLNFIGVENIVGSAGDDFVNLVGTVSGLVVDLGDGNDTLSVAGGASLVSVVNVENINRSDYLGLGGEPATDDTLTLLSNVSSVTVNLQLGTNTINLAAGSNSFDNLFNISEVNGTSSDDTLTLLGNGANTIDLGGGTDTLNLTVGASGFTVVDAEAINGSAAYDNFTIGNISGSTTVTAGAGSDAITASLGQDNFRFASVADLTISGVRDAITGFDAGSDTFTFSGITFGGDGHIEYVDTGSFAGNGQASAHLQLDSPGNGLLQIDVDGNGAMDANDMEISLSNFTGPLSNSNFLLT